MRISYFAFWCVCPHKQVFYGREEEVKKVEDYIKGPSVNPLLLHGAGGCGKTSLLAKCASSCVEWLSHTKPILVIRFVGTSPESTALTPLLTSICHQVSCQREKS